MLRECGSHTPS